MLNMFSSVAWANYISTVFVLVIIYYLVVGIKFYSHEFKNMFSGKHKSPEHNASSQNELEDVQLQPSPIEDNQQELFGSHKQYMPSVEETDETFEQVQELTVRLKEVIEVAYSKNYIKEEFIHSLQLLIREYQFLKGSPFMVAINNLIASECEKQGYLLLDAEERVMLWNE